jgi:hypothetical protein
MPVLTTFLLGSILMWLGLRTMEIFAIFAATPTPQLQSYDGTFNYVKFSATTAASGVLKLGCTTESTTVPLIIFAPFLVTSPKNTQEVSLDALCRKGLLLFGIIKLTQCSSAGHDGKHT